MVIKEVILPSEKQKIVDFLAKYNLNYEQNIDQTIYLEDGDKVVATVSASKYIIKCLAADPAYRSENYAATLVSEMIKRLHMQGIYYYQVFTKAEYRVIFESLGFKSLLDTEKVSVLEGGDGDIQTEIKKMQTQIKYGFGIKFPAENYDVACIVINGNPFTNGHLQLVEYASKRHEFVLVFVLEEEGSEFSFKERFSMAYLATKPCRNVMVLPSSRYVVSKATFPSYFLKSVDESTQEYATYDAMIFTKYFMPQLSIVKRYVGTETVDYMSVYNQTLSKVLGDKLEIVPRFEENGQVISARAVRKMLDEGKFEEAMQYIPRTNHAIFMLMDRFKR